MAPTVTDAELDMVIRLLKKNSSLNAVSAFLKRRELAFSAGSWPVMRDERMKPALKVGTLDRGDLIQLLRDSEEYGRQHVFLYKCSRDLAGELTNESYLRARLKKMGIEDLLDSPRIVESPSGLQLVETRLELMSGGNSFVAKFVDVRKYREQISANTIGDEQTIIYRFREDRVVNVLRIAPDGMTEVRIQTHRKATSYAEEAENVFNKIAGTLDRLQFEDFSLSKARRFILEKGPELASSIKFGSGVARTKKGASVTLAATVWGQGIFGTNDEEVEGALATLVAKGGGRSTCDDVNCIWVSQKGGGGLSTDTHVLIGGQNNEFQIVPQCDRADYLYVLTKLINYAK